MKMKKIIIRRRKRKRRRKKQVFKKTIYKVRYKSDKPCYGMAYSFLAFYLVLSYGSLNHSVMKGLGMSILETVNCRPLTLLHKITI